MKNCCALCGGWNTAGTQQRYAIRLTEGNTGFYLWSYTNSGSKTFVRAFSIDNLTDAMAESTAVNGDELGNGYITDAAISNDGVRFRILRIEDTFYLYALNGETWVLVGSVSCTAGDKTDIEFYGVTASYEWSAITMASLTYVEEKAATADADGNIAYYTDGTNYWFEDGEQTTKDGVMLYMPVDVTLTVNGIALDGETSEAVAAGTVTVTVSAQYYDDSLEQSIEVTVLAA